MFVNPAILTGFRMCQKVFLLVIRLCIAYFLVFVFRLYVALPKRWLVTLRPGIVQPRWRPDTRLWWPQIWKEELGMIVDRAAILDSLAAKRSRWGLADTRHLRNGKLLLKWRVREGQPTFGEKWSPSCHWFHSAKPSKRCSELVKVEVIWCKQGVYWNWFAAKSLRFQQPKYFQMVQQWNVL